MTTNKILHIALVLSISIFPIATKAQDRDPEQRLFANSDFIKSVRLKSATITKYSCFNGKIDQKSGTRVQREEFNESGQTCSLVSSSADRSTIREIHCAYDELHHLVSKDVIYSNKDVPSVSKSKYFRDQQSNMVIEELTLGDSYRQVIKHKQAQFIDNITESERVRATANPEMMSSGGITTEYDGKNVMVRTSDTRRMKYEYDNNGHVIKASVYRYSENGSGEIISEAVITLFGNGMPQKREIYNRSKEHVETYIYAYEYYD